MTLTRDGSFGFDGFDEGSWTGAAKSFLGRHLRLDSLHEQVDLGFHVVVLRKIELSVKVDVWR